MVRDAAEIVGLGLPCFCRGVTPNSAFPSGPGEVGLPLALGEVTIDSGDLVLGDRDGVVIVAQADLPRSAERLARVAVLEAEMHAKIARGRSARCSTAGPSCATRSRTSISGRFSGRAVPGRAGQRGTTLR